MVHFENKKVGLYGLDGPVDWNRTCQGTVHKHLWGDLMQKGILKSLDPPKGRGPKKSHKFSWKNWVYMIFMGLTHNFQVKKRGPEIFEVWKGAPKNFHDDSFFISPQQVSVNSPQCSHF